MTIKDMRGRQINVGDIVAKAEVLGRSGDLRIAECTRIENGKMYLDNSKVAINFPSRLLVINETIQYEIPSTT